LGYKLRTDIEQLRLKILKKLRTASLNSTQNLLVFIKKWNWKNIQEIVIMKMLEVELSNYCLISG